MDVDLGKMIGPLPLGAWLATVGGGLALMVYTRRQNPVTATEAAPDPNPGVGDGSVGGWVQNAPATGGVAPDPTTNEEWAVMAVNGLIAMGYAPLVADSAIRKYMDGGSGMSATEFALVSIALAKYGMPPVPLPAPVFGTEYNNTPIPSEMVQTPAAAPDVPEFDENGQYIPPFIAGPTPYHIPLFINGQPSSRLNVRTYTIKSGDSLYSIASKFNVSWQSIYNANPRASIPNPNWVIVGKTILIPNS